MKGIRITVYADELKLLLKLRKKQAEQATERYLRISAKKHK